MILLARSKCLLKRAFNVILQDRLQTVHFSFESLTKTIGNVFRAHFSDGKLKRESGIRTVMNTKYELKLFECTSCKASRFEFMKKSMKSLSVSCDGPIFLLTSLSNAALISLQITSLCVLAIS